MVHKDPLQELMVASKPSRKTIFNHSLIRKSKKDSVKEAVKNEPDKRDGSGAEEEINKEGKGATPTIEKDYASTETKVGERPDGNASTVCDEATQIHFKSPFRSQSKVKRTPSRGKSSPVKIPSFLTKLEIKHRKDIAQLEAQKKDLEIQNREEKEKLKREEENHERYMEGEGNKLTEFEKKVEQADKEAKGFIKSSEINEDAADFALQNGAKNSSIDDSCDLPQNSPSHCPKNSEANINKVSEMGIESPKESTETLENSKPEVGAASDFSPLVLLGDSAVPKQYPAKVDTDQGASASSGPNGDGHDKMSGNVSEILSEKVDLADGVADKSKAKADFETEKINNHLPKHIATKQKLMKAKDHGLAKEVGSSSGSSSDNDALIRVGVSTHNTNSEAEADEPATINSNTYKNLDKATETATVGAEETEEKTFNSTKTTATKSPMSEGTELKPEGLQTASSPPKKSFFRMLPSGLLLKHHSNPQMLQRGSGSDSKVDPKVLQKIESKDQKNKAKVAAIKAKTKLQMKSFEELYDAQIAVLIKQIATIDASISKNEDEANEAIDKAQAKHVENTKKLDEEHEETKTKLYQETESKIEKKMKEIKDTRKDQTNIEDELKELEAKESDLNKTLEGIKLEIAELKQKIIAEKKKQEDLTKIKQEKISAIKDSVNLKRKLLGQLKEAEKSNEQLAKVDSSKKQDEYVKKIHDINKSMVKLVEELDNTVQNSKNSSHRQTDLESLLVDREYDEYKALERKSELQLLHEKAASKSKIELDNPKSEKKELDNLDKGKNEEHESPKKTNDEILQKIEEARSKRETLTKELKEVDADLFEIIERESFIEVEAGNSH